MNHSNRREERANFFDSLLDIDDPLPTNSSSSTGVEPTSEEIGLMVEMGFTENQGRKALKETVRFPSRFFISC